MKVLKTSNVDSALMQGVKLLKEQGVEKSPRGHNTLDMCMPIATVYHDPSSPICWDSRRDCNPFLHLFDAFWIIAGRRDVAPLSFFSKQMETFSDNGEWFHGAYGHRLRHHFGFDQIEACVRKLSADPSTRQAVLTLWDPQDDYEEGHKDYPCNNMIYLKVDNNVLRMTVVCRSNDIVWGAYGANVVQFSILMQYIHARLKCGFPELKLGTYTQISDSYHAYTDSMSGKVFNKLSHEFEINGMCDNSSIILDPAISKSLNFGTISDSENQLLLEELNILMSIVAQRLSSVPENYKHPITKKLSNYYNHHRAHKGLTHNCRSLNSNEDWDLACLLWLERKNK